MSGTSAPRVEPPGGADPGPNSRAVADGAAAPAATPAPAEPPARDRTGLAVLALRVSAVLYVLFGLLLLVRPFAWDPATTVEYGLRSKIVWGLGIGCFVFAVLVVLLARGLRRRRRWAWIGSNVLFAFYLPSAFLPLALLGYFGLLSPGTRKQFPVPRSDTVRRRA